MHDWHLLKPFCIRLWLPLTVQTDASWVNWRLSLASRCDCDSLTLCFGTVINRLVQGVASRRHHRSSRRKISRSDDASALTHSYQLAFSVREPLKKTVKVDSGIDFNGSRLSKRGRCLICLYRFDIQLPTQGADRDNTEDQSSGL